MPYAAPRPEDIYTDSYLVEPGPHDEWEPFEDTPEDHMEGIFHHWVLRYAAKTTKSGRWLESELYPVWKKKKYAPKGDIRLPSSTAQQKLNERNAARKFFRKMNENFTVYRDWWVTLTADDEHLFADEDEASHAVELFLERQRRLYAKHGHSLKYMLRMEYKDARDKYHRPLRDDRGRQLIRMHIHGVLNEGPPDTEIIRRWKMGSVAKLVRLQPRKTGFAGISHYVTKETRNGRRRFTCSLGLKTPQPRRALSHKMTGKTAVKKLAADMGLRPAYFEKMYKQYRFVDCEARYNRVNDGVYLYCRMELREPP